MRTALVLSISGQDGGCLAEATIGLQKPTSGLLVQK